MQAGIANDAFVTAGDGNGQCTTGCIEKRTLNKIAMLKFSQREIETEDVTEKT